MTSPEIRREQDFLDELHRFADLPDDVCFGRLDHADGRSVHIGRAGVFRDDEPLLLDWRAPAARPFYTATAASPEGVIRRRRITTRGRTVLAVDDELLGDGEVDGVTGDAALLQAVTAARGDRMRTVVTTLRAEQDAVIRSDHAGVLVIDGGPGTGKTAVALHRVAHLLYRRPHLAARGVLVVGPNRLFLDYIGQVLPGLGEDRVVTTTVDRLLPGIAPDRAEPAEVAELKGRAVLAEVLADAVRSYVRGGEVEVEFEGHRLVVDTAEAVWRARRAGLPHGPAGSVFHREVVDALVRALAGRMEAVVLSDDGEALDGGRADGGLGAADVRALEAVGFVVDPDDLGPRPVLDDDDLADLRAALLASADVRAAVAEVWPDLTPTRVLDDLYADPSRARGLSPAERDALRRSPGGWTAADVPLLDEAAALVGAGPDRSGASFAEHTAGRSLAQRAADRSGGSFAERAAADPGWAFGHVVVDEAQELSPMAWRAVLRRCPSRSLTVVGDLDQGGRARSWDEVLGPHVGDRWRRTRLTVTYRTPAEVVAAAAAVLDVEPPTAIRSTGVRPWRKQSTDLPADVAAWAATEARHEGRFAVVAPEHLVPELAAALPDDRFRALTPRQVKGLEFDSVLVVDPAAILAEPRDLYVAMTRTTHRLGLLHPGPPPEQIVDLPELSPASAPPPCPAHG